MGFHWVWILIAFIFSNSASVVIGAPKANTSQVNVTEGGSVFYCPWSLSQTHCHSIEFDTEGKFNEAFFRYGHTRHLKRVQECAKR